MKWQTLDGLNKKYIYIEEEEEEEEDLVLTRVVS